MEAAAAVNGKELLHSAHANGMNEWICVLVSSVSFCGNQDFVKYCVCKDNTTILSHDAFVNIYLNLCYLSEPLFLKHRKR